MEPSIWGEHGWIFLHSVTMAYPENPSFEDKKRFGQFFNLLEYILPCFKCQKNYGKKLKKKPVENHLNSRKDLVSWLIDIHNIANEYAGKPIFTYDEVIEIYKVLYETGKLPSKKNIKQEKDISKSYKYICLGLLIFIISIVFIYILVKYF